ncbi:MAG: EAL domain-containing protein [Actinobacteria bacterium]|nr:EAL domain-containing protein [Actinomycetota bacterium]
MTGSPILREQPGHASRWSEAEGLLETVVGLADLLSDRARDMSAAARNEVIEQLATQAATAMRVVENLSLAARLATGDVSLSSDTVELADLVESVADGWTQRHGVRVRVDGVGVALGDTEWMRTVVDNVLDDAFARGAGEIEVMISEGYSKTSIEIHDNGQAVPDSDLALLAEPYHRNQASEWEGSVLGRGVVVARGLVKGMGGEVRCFRVDERNSCEITLRRQGDGVPRRRQVSRLAEAPRERQPSADDVLGLIANSSMTMVYQPIVNMGRPDASETLGYESLARFPHSDPTTWFRLAGSAGVGVDLELLAVSAGVAGFASEDGDVFLSLNLSNAGLLAPGLVMAIEGIAPGRLVLELSDTARIRSYEVTRRAVSALRERGVRLAVDDVGADEIDMWHILRLDPEIIKLDRQLVADRDNIRRNNALIKGLTTMAADLGVMVIAEAVENEAEKQRLLELGVVFGQGYLFGKPEPLLWKTRVLSD